MASEVNPNVAPASETTLEVRSERDRDIRTGQKLVRIKYRERGGNGRWSKCLVVLDEDQTFGEVMNLATEIAEAHKAGALEGGSA